MPLVATRRLEEALNGTREHVPLDWAMAQNNLGNALLSLGKRECGTARLEEAAAAYRAALLAIMGRDGEQSRQCA